MIMFLLSRVPIDEALSLLLPIASLLPGNGSESSNEEEEENVPIPFIEEEMTLSLLPLVNAVNQ